MDHETFWETKWHLNFDEDEIKIVIQLISLNIFIGITYILSSKVLCKVSRNFTIPNLRKMQITIDFNGNLGHLWGVITH